MHGLQFSPWSQCVLEAPVSHQCYFLSLPSPSLRSVSMSSDEDYYYYYYYYYYY